jgi:hypothetical protein
MKKSDIAAFSLLGEMNSDLPPPPPKEAKKLSRWKPKINPGAQQQLFDSKTRNILAWSEKGSGKTWGAVEKGVDHCVTYNDALFVIVVKVKGQANMGGAWDKLQKILKIWKEKKGISYSKIMLDSQKNERIWVQNEKGGWSQIVLISAPFGSQIKDKMPGYEASFILVDELTTCDSREYYLATAAQVGRREGIPGEAQQWVGCCNPKGPSHWAYKLFFEEPLDQETGEWDPDYETIYFPSEENVINLPKGYLEHVAKIYRNDPIESLRLASGEWVDKPSGESIFGNIFNVNLHVRPLNENGQPHQKIRLMPSSKHALIIGIDSGNTYQSFTLAQWLPVDGRLKYVVFDEVVILKKRLAYAVIIPILMRRVKYWFDLVGLKRIVAVSDDSAFKMFRPGHGSFDYMDMEREWNGDRVKRIPARNVEMGLPELKIKMCPKFNGSVKARIRCLTDALSQEEILINSNCKKHQTMLRMLESEKQDDKEEFDSEAAVTPKRSDHLHCFDSLTYIMLMGALAPWKLSPSEGSGQMLIKVA